MSKQFITANQLLEDAFRLGEKIILSEFRPTFIVGVWRGGAPIGIAIQELFSYCGIETDHIAIRTSYYYGIEQRTSQVRVHGLNYIVQRAKSGDRLLLVDDVFDTGASMREVIRSLQDKYGEEMPEVRIATPYYKPSKNVTDITPDYYLHETDQWLVFPHELQGLTERELSGKPGIAVIGDFLRRYCGSSG